jgi:serine/threonine protein phosphatase PrpC
MAKAGGSILAKAGADLVTSPRFESDKEDGTSKKTQDANINLVNEQLASLETGEKTNLSVDKKMLEGRRANRGFTVSHGSGSAAAAVSAEGRSTRRAQTLPAATRRGDFILSEEALAELREKQQMMLARKRRGSATFEFRVVPDEELESLWKKETTCMVYGMMTEGQKAGQEREWHFGNGTKLPGANPVIIACQKGSKGFRDTTPNQDNFSVTYFKNGWTLACTFDGHGAFGHIVSTRTVQTVPYYLFNSEAFGKGDMKTALTEAFDRAQDDLVVHALENGWDVQASGSTAVAALWKGNKVFTANAGDSRCVIGTEADKSLVFQTEDHKPNTESEKARIESLGGEVRTQTYSDGWVNHRIFVKGQSFPGLCMARTFGDVSVKSHGVIATPEVVETDIPPADKKPFLVLASDGVWEFMDSQFVVKAMAKKIVAEGPKVSVQRLQREAQKRWKAEEGDYCDDITSILVQLY